ncbi:MAG: RCC1 domain-containing protein [Gemmatimonadales bacterium]
MFPRPRLQAPPPWRSHGLVGLILAAATACGGGSPADPTSGEKIWVVVTAPGPTEVSDRPFTQPPRLAARDGAGNVLPLPSTGMLVSVVAGPPGARLFGTTAFPVGAGEVVLSEFGIAGPPGSYELRFASSGWTPATATVHLQSPPPDYRDVAAAVAYTCALTVQSRVRCWGDWADGGIVVYPREIAPDLEIASLVAGVATTCGLQPDGSAYCWGAGALGQLGNGAAASAAAPVPVAGGLRFKSLSVGRIHACGATLDDVAYCWGASEFWTVLGVPDVFLSLVPVAVDGGHAFTTVATGDRHACGLTPAGLAFCWGGAFGHSERPTPVAVRGDHQFTQLVAGGTLSCGLTATGAGWCWDAADGAGPGPLPMPGSGQYAQVALSTYRRCAIRFVGTLCWGAGPVGDGTTQAVDLPTPVSGGYRFTRIAVGDGHTCAVTELSVLYCWGVSQFRAVGVNTSGDMAPYPSLVLPPP